MSGYDSSGVPDVRYYRDIQKYPLLGPAEQLALARRAKAGDADAAERLVRANLRFVITVARRYIWSGVPLPDLIQAGNSGLTLAISHFDPDRGYRFISYAVWWVRQQMYELISQMSRPVRVPMSYHLVVMRVSRVRERLYHQLERLPTLEELIAASGHSPHEVSVALQLLQPVQSLDEPVWGTDDETGLDQLQDEGSAEAAAERSKLEQYIARAMWQLTPREQIIIRHYFGLAGSEELRYKEIGEILAIGRERVRQICNDALAKLREDERLREYITAARAA